MQQKVRVGITIGDINGIGPEVIIKTLYNQSVQEHCIPIIYGSSKVVSYHKNVVKLNDFTFTSIQSAERLNHRKVNVLNCWEDTVNITLGKATTEGGQYAYIALDRAVRDLKDGLIDVLVTGPVNKHAMQLVNFPATGHTEYLEKEIGGKALMVMVNEDFRVALVTGHIPLGEVSSLITKENVENALNLFIDTLKIDFGIDKPKVAILGLNPHASDEGLMGGEEEEVLQPLILEFKNAGHLVMGPYSSDGFFGSGLYRKFDGILAMYHDQGLIPFKALSFGQGVNYTAGLSCIRTSPDHGTAYDLVGTNSANEQSFRRALYLAVDMFRARAEYKDLEENSIRNVQKPAASDSENKGRNSPKDRPVAVEQIKEDKAQLSEPNEGDQQEKTDSNLDAQISVVGEETQPSTETEQNDIKDESKHTPTVVEEDHVDNIEASNEDNNEEIKAKMGNVPEDEIKKEPKSSEDVETVS